ncbi:formylglycine-generating enzyme family protein [Zestomonas carbonaria]|uniref:Serine/threonine-protein kinase Pkn1 n=1 Tax=Zestomonas carbonaria TaxID=2762745 RepID=A0A7U7IBJ7_9GAMM|nr:SUMF1/EgtB/PvdO family nonheme iron enzyme [Pseudomonas carbonaria]CAD5110560.1 Serine/threonine-protein kinase Pkn1 [Pseudomonas carbonaria]
MIRTLYLLPLAFLLAACQAAVPPSQSLGRDQVLAIQQRIDQRYPEQPEDERKALLQQVLTAIDNMLFVEGGTFEMGDFGWIDGYDWTNMCEWPCGQPREELFKITYKADTIPLHKVRLDSFYLSKYHTTYGENDRYRRLNGLPLYDAELTEEDRAKGMTRPRRLRVSNAYLPDLPTSTEKWQDAKGYCLWLGELSGLPVDLPTEAQYEYAARSRGRYVVYATDNGSINEGRNINDKSRIQPVGSFPPNPLGLYEMGANVASWVNDWYAADYYEHSPVDNPQGPETGTYKVIRGSDAYSSRDLAMTAWRHHSDPNEGGMSTSFRCAIQQSTPLRQ